MKTWAELAASEGHRPNKKWVYGYNKVDDVTLWPEGDHRCKECGGPIPLHRFNSTWIWLRKQFCSQRCKSAHQVGRPSGKRKEPIPKVCLGCGRQFHRRKRDALPDFEKRKTCGRKVCHSRVVARSVAKAHALRKLTVTAQQNPID